MDLGQNSTETTNVTPPVSSSANITQYITSHNIPFLLDRMVKDILVEKPQDSNSWMLRWFLERHRQQCEAKHLNSSSVSSVRGV